MKTGRSTGRQYGGTEHQGGAMKVHRKDGSTTCHNSRGREDLGRFGSESEETPTLSNKWIKTEEEKKDVPK